MKKSLKIIALVLAVYLLLLFLLVTAESASEDASITNMFEAFWFSMITMTTVGYGDMSPVTAFGRVIGLLFALCSMGLLAAAISLGLGVINRKVLPRLKLRLAKNREWYVFNEENTDTAVLAKALHSEHPEAALIFPAGDAVYEGNALRLEYDLQMLLKLKGSKEGISMLFFRENGWENYTDALEAADAGLPSYCIADISAKRIPPELRIFARTECLSRCYWKEHPITSPEQCIVLIGCGNNGKAILERALLTNIFPSGRGLAYHVFESNGDFERLHPELLKSLSSPEEPDSLRFYSEHWSAYPELLEKADRIILCGDSDEENLNTYRELTAWFPIPGTVHVHLSAPVAGINCFGSREEILTPEFVLLDEVNRRARKMNDIYNAGSPSPTHWNELSEFLRQSNIAAADHLPVKLRWLLGDDSLTEVSRESCRKAMKVYRKIYPEKRLLMEELEHRRWMRFHLMYNWQYAPVRNNPARKHPMLVPFEQLSEKERIKDDYAWEIAAELGE